MLSAKKRRKTGIFCFYSPNYECGCSLTTDHAVALSIHCNLYKVIAFVKYFKCSIIMVVIDKIPMYHETLTVIASGMFQILVGVDLHVHVLTVFHIFETSQMMHNTIINPYKILICYVTMSLTSRS